MGKKKLPATLVNKAALDKRVALLLGQRARAVSAVTEAFLHEIVDVLVEDFAVRLDGLGDLCIQERHNRSGHVQQLYPPNKVVHGKAIVVDMGLKRYAYLRKGTRLNDRLRERYGKRKSVEVKMEKFGVDEGQDDAALEKKAAAGCPNCGSKPEVHGHTLICPKCGSQPWESDSGANDSK